MKIKGSLRAAALVVCLMMTMAVCASAAEVEFEGVGGDEARGLIGCHCLIRRDELDESLFAEEPSFWEGWAVVDDEVGEVGDVVGIIENPAQTLLEVNRKGKGGSVLIPVVDEIVREVAAVARVVHVSLPAGLLDLNA